MAANSPLKHYVSYTSLGHARLRSGALLAVLWLSAGLASIAFSVSAMVRSETERVSTVE